MEKDSKTPQNVPNIDNNPHKKWLVEQIAVMANSTQPHLTMIYKLLKSQLQPLGHWKEKPRGIGFKSGHDPRRVTLVKKDQ